MRDRIDRSRRIGRLIEFLSNSLAQQRGLVPVIGLLITIIGWLILLVSVFVQNRFVEFSGLFLQGIGIIAALIGLLLSEPLGR